MAPAALSPEPLARVSNSPTLPRSSLKRKRSSPEGESTEVTSQSDKRRKVAFDPDVEVRRVDELGGKSVLLISEEIKHAIRQHERGIVEEYEQIKAIFAHDHFSDEALPADELRKYLLGLVSNATLLGKSCHDLVNTVLDIHWLIFSDTLTALYTRFLGNLVSSQPGYLGRVLTKLVENFAHISSPGGSLSGQSRFARRDLLVKVHVALKYILQLVPLANRELSSALSSAFPHPTDSTRAHVEYVRNALTLTEYSPALKADVLALIVDRLIKIDVQVQTDVEDLEEEAEELLIQGGLGQGVTSVQDLLKDDDDDSDAESVSSDESVDEDFRRIKALRSAVEKIDSIMDLLFAYFDPVFVKGSARESQSVFGQLMSLFRKTILPTGRSRHTQFLIFHFAQTSPALTSSFIDVCMQILQDRTVRSSFLRFSAAAYIGSFVARGKHVSTTDVRYVFHHLGKILDQLRQTYESTCIVPDMHKYGAYYGIAQALIYIFCFRWKDLVVNHEELGDDEEDDDDIINGRDLIFLPGVKETLSYNMMSKLNPLKVCAPEIVNEYARVAHSLRFLYVYSILEQNRRVRLSQIRQNTTAGSSRETALSTLHGERHHQLDAYFPFDPYNLPASKRWIVGDYNEWKGVPGQRTAQEAVDHDGSSQGDVAEEVDLEDEGTETPVEDD